MLRYSETSNEQIRKGSFDLMSTFGDDVMIVIITEQLMKCRLTIGERALAYQGCREFVTRKSELA